MEISLIKKISNIDQLSKGKRGIAGYFKISTNDYDYQFIPSPVSQRSVSQRFIKPTQHGDTKTKHTIMS